MRASLLILGILLIVGCRREEKSSSSNDDDYLDIKLTEADLVGLINFVEKGRVYSALPNVQGIDTATGSRVIIPIN